MEISPVLQVTFSDAYAKNYPIFMGEGLFNKLGALLTPYLKQEVCIVCDENVAAYYLQKVEDQVTPLVAKFKKIILPAGESTKTLASAEKIWQFLLENRFSRNMMLIALGGGVIGDLTGFVASAYQRGVPFIQLPTTLLSQVDSSVGGKTGVNHALGKNMIGAFHQPSMVVIDPLTLSTLSKRELVAGLVEVIKYGFIYDETFLMWCEAHWGELIALNYQKLGEAIKRSCEIKAQVVGQDERESGLRAILNFGHTFGHAIEGFTQYKTWLHGEAIAVGMLMALDLSARMGWIEPAMVSVTRTLFQQAALPVNPPQDMTVNDFVSFMLGDKKNINQKIRLVLLERQGKALVTDVYNEKAFYETLNQFVAS